MSRYDQLCFQVWSYLHGWRQVCIVPEALSWLHRTMPCFGRIVRTVWWSCKYFREMWLAGTATNGRRSYHIADDHSGAP